jgi:purine-binding chemotaxis protein CheW
MKNSDKNHHSSQTAADCFPKNIESIRVLNERAKQIATPIAETKINMNESSYIHFRLGKSECYGIPYTFIKEVIDNSSLAKIPCIPEFIAGLINFRGSLIAVLDLKYFFHIKSNKTTANSFPSIIIVSSKETTVGILADDILGSVVYESDLLDKPISSEGITKPEYITGLHQGRTTIINIDTILSDPQLLIKASNSN